MRKMNNVSELRYPELSEYKSIMFFTGAGMSAESGVPVYRGEGGIWNRYHWQEYACQEAFDRDPGKVLDFHELRRASVLKCQPHKGHKIITDIQCSHASVSIVTQNIDGMHQRAGAENVIELHGSLWRVRCPVHGTSEDMGESYNSRQCLECGRWLRPDITWFEDMLDINLLAHVERLVKQVELFICIGTSGVVYPAAMFPPMAKDAGARTVCINTERPADEKIFDFFLQGKAGDILDKMFTKP